jgi:NAD(P)H-hydrate repair Nnr-like enzyme with NAD(P)H-hydrate dehydratase domain
LPGYSACLWGVNPASTAMRDFELQNQLLYPDLFWSRPVTAAAAGRLLVVGGSAGEFSSLQQVHLWSTSLGVGECRIIVPDSLASRIGTSPDVEFAASTPTGSLARAAAEQIVSLADQADAILLGLNWSNNSESTILLETLFRQLRLPLIVTQQALHLLPAAIDRHLIVAEWGDLIKLANRWRIPLNFEGSGLLAKVAVVKQIAAEHPADYFIFGPEVIVAAAGRISVTPQPAQNSVLSVAAASAFAVQYPKQPYQALTTAAWLQREAKGHSSSQAVATRLRQALAQYD